jgi:hypothetical protein
MSVDLKLEITSRGSRIDCYSITTSRAIAASRKVSSKRCKWISSGKFSTRNVISAKRMMPPWAERFY